jgi:hypothetical protein
MTDPPPPPASPPPAAPPPAGPPPAGPPRAAPPPPSGPGVRPPFVAPPTDGLRRRRRIGVISAIVSVLLLCGGIVAGINVLIAAGNAAYRAEARDVVAEYAGDLNLQRYSAAYDLLCVQDQRVLPESEFEAGYLKRPVHEWMVHDAQLVRGTAVVRADFKYFDGTVESHDYPVIVTDDGLRICA